MRKLHRRLIQLIRDMTRTSRAAYGAVPGGSPIKHVRRHSGRRFLYLLDLSNAYRNVKSDVLAELVARSLNADPATTLKLLGKYFMAKEGGLATGGPASPDLFNLYAGQLIDAPLLALCGRYSLVYTRYIDDLLFSAKVPIGKKKRRTIRRIVEEFFAVNHKKCKVIDLRNQDAQINGVGLRLDGSTFLPRRYRRKITGLMHIVSGGETKNAETESRLDGMVGLLIANTHTNGSRSSRLVRSDARLMQQYRLFKKTTGRGKR